jgi:deazaflavin-dependent oxidoreductase (nitroreductase family)
MDVPNVPVCYLETTGRVSGRPHEIEIWYAARGSTLYLLSGGRDRSDWVKNLIQDPRVRVRVDGRTYAGLAAVIEGTAEEQGAREAVVAKYYGWRAGPLPNAWARESLPVAIRLEAAADA